MTQIRLTNGKVMLVDSEDVQLLKQWRWREDRRKYTSYAERTQWCDSRSIKIRAHRVILEAHGHNLSGCQIDHRDGNGLNNTKLNLRVTGACGNQANRPAPCNNVTGYKGVHKCARSGQYIAKLSGSQQKYLGTFTSAIAAACAYDIAAKEHYGEFAQLNFTSTELLLALEALGGSLKAYTNRSRKNSSTGYRGVTKQGNHFVARCQIAGARTRVGVYATAEAAARAFDAVATQHGLKGRLNFT